MSAENNKTVGGGRKDDGGGEITAIKDSSLMTWLNEYQRRIKATADILKQEVATIQQQSKVNNGQQKSGEVLFSKDIVGSFQFVISKAVRDLSSMSTVMAEELEKRYNLPAGAASTNSMPCSIAGSSSVSVLRTRDGLASSPPPMGILNGDTTVIPCPSAHNGSDLTCPEDDDYASLFPRSNDDDDVDMDQVESEQKWSPPELSDRLIDNNNDADDNENCEIPEDGFLLVPKSEPLSDEHEQDGEEEHGLLMDDNNKLMSNTEGLLAISQVESIVKLENETNDDDDDDDIASTQRPVINNDSREPCSSNSLDDTESNDRSELQYSKKQSMITRKVQEECKENISNSSDAAAAAAADIQEDGKESGGLKMDEEMKHIISVRRSARIKLRKSNLSSLLPLLSDEKMTKDNKETSNSNCSSGAVYVAPFPGTSWSQPLQFPPHRRRLPPDHNYNKAPQPVRIIQKRNHVASHPQTYWSQPLQFPPHRRRRLPPVSLARTMKMRNVCKHDEDVARPPAIRRQQQQQQQQDDGGQLNRGIAAAVLRNGPRNEDIGHDKESGGLKMDEEKLNISVRRSVRIKERKSNHSSLLSLLSDKEMSKDKDSNKTAQSGCSSGTVDVAPLPGTSCSQPRRNVHRQCDQDVAQQPPTKQQHDDGGQHNRVIAAAAGLRNGRRKEDIERDFLCIGKRILAKSRSKM